MLVPHGVQPDGGGLEYRFHLLQRQVQLKLDLLPNAQFSSLPPQRAHAGLVFTVPATPDEHELHLPELVGHRAVFQVVQKLLESSELERVVLLGAELGDGDDEESLGGAVRLHVHNVRAPQLGEPFRVARWVDQNRLPRPYEPLILDMMEETSHVGRSWC